MAQKVSIHLVDDIDGSDADETVSFGLDGASYEIDLTEKRAAALRKALEKYVGSARKVSGRTSKSGRTRKSSSGSSSSSDTAAMREWAKSNGYEIAERGRVPREVQDAYAAANR